MSNIVTLAGKPLDKHGNMWFALYVAPARKGGTLNVRCWYKVKGTRNDNGPKNNLGQDMYPDGEAARHSRVVMQGYLNGELRYEKGDGNFDRALLDWNEDIKLAPGLAAAILTIRENQWADPEDWHMVLTFTEDE